MSVTDYDSVIEFILAFYESLGWNPTAQQIDPRKIRIHPVLWKQICKEIKQRWDVTAAMTWMNFGPSGDEENKLYLALDEVEIVPDAMEDVAKDSSI